MNDTIINAIKRQEILSLTYDGIPREVEPHAYGIAAKATSCCAAIKYLAGTPLKGRTNGNCLPSLK
jgi:hypothetical protein